MNKKYFVGFFCALAIKLIPVLAQSGGGCGTIVSPEQKTLENTVNITEGKPTQSPPKVNRTLSITVFVVKNQAGVPGISESNIQIAVNTLNQIFNPIALKFQICSFQYIDNYQYDVFDPGTQEKDLLTLYYEVNTINLYLFKSISGETGFGYTYMPGDVGKHAIFIGKSGIMDGSTLAHQVGHFLNLYHTHEDTFGAELVDESNCRTAGDRCCDTDADPVLLGKVSGDCVYTGLNLMGGIFYHPDPKNIMSFSYPNCRCVFSRTQFLRMIDALTRLRTNLR